MRTGVSISRHRISVVAVRGRKIAWAGERDLTQLSDLETALMELLVEAPGNPGRVSVVLESDVCQTKVLRGLPQLTPAGLSQAIGLQAERWFLRNGRPLVANGVWLERGRTALAAAVEDDVLELVAGSVRASGLTARVIGTATEAAARVAGTHHRSLADGIAETVVVENGVIASIRRRKAEPSPDRGTEIPELDRTLDVDAKRFVSAYGAALADPDLVLEQRGPSTVAAMSSRRVVVVALAALGLWAAGLGVRYYRLRMAGDTAQRELRVLQPSMDRALSLQLDLVRAGEAVGTLEDWMAGRSEDLVLLAALTATLPDSAYLTTLRRDRRNSVTLTGVAPSASELVVMLERQPGVSKPRLDGPVSRVGGSGRETFTIRFQWRSSR